MDDEPDTNLESEPEVGPEPEPEKESEPESKKYSEEEVTNINRTWEGRTKSAVRDALQAVGIGVNEVGQYYSLNPDPAPAAEEEPYVDEDTKKYVQQAIMQGVNAQLSQVLPAVDMALEQGLRAQYEDWNEVKEAVRGTLASSGMTLAHAVRTPQLIDTLVYAERGKKSYAKEQETKKQAEAERKRQALLSSAGGINSGGREVTAGHLTAEDRDNMVALNIKTEGEYVDLVNGPAKVKVGGE